MNALTALQNYTTADTVWVALSIPNVSKLETIIPVEDYNSLMKRSKYFINLVDAVAIIQSFFDVEESTLAKVNDYLSEYTKTNPMTITSSKDIPIEPSPLDYVDTYFYHGKPVCRVTTHPTAPLVIMETVNVELVEERLPEGWSVVQSRP